MKVIRQEGGKKGSDEHDCNLGMYRFGNRERN